MHVGRLDSQVAPGAGSVLLEEELEAYGVFDVLGERELNCTTSEERERQDIVLGYVYFFIAGWLHSVTALRKTGGEVMVYTKHQG